MDKKKKMKQPKKLLDYKEKTIKTSLIIISNDYGQYKKLKRYD